MSPTPTDAFPFRPFAPTLLTGLFLPAGAPPPEDAPLPDAPLPNPHLRLPVGGVTLFYGNNAPGLMGQALQRAQQQGYYGIGGRVFAQFGQVQPASRALPDDQLLQVEVMWLNRIYCARETAERIQQHLRRYLAETGRIDAAPAAALRFAEVSHHPELLDRLLAEPEFSHLRAVVLTLPGVEAPDGNRPAAQIMYVRDLTALKVIQVDYGASLEQKVFRIPMREEVAQPRSLFNPFVATLPKPSVVYVRPWPVG
ncbi:MAG: hypothetical protein KDJ28_07265 [Candidatus Competibacteraceae bacterium]|nr:hypothetical protein [Candidatus Competibacteraceae bacterium]